MAKVIEAKICCFKKKSIMKEFNINGVKTIIINKPDFDIIGYTRLVNLNGSSIAKFIEELNETGQMKNLSKTLQTPQQIWVCLSGAGNSEFDCRCTVCVEKTKAHDFSRIEENELFTLSAPASEWADFEIGENQSPTELHSFMYTKWLKKSDISSMEKWDFIWIMNTSGRREKRCIFCCLLFSNESFVST